MANRTVTLPGIWAENAIELPISDDPTVGVTYRKATLSEAEIQDGWLYATINPSHITNEVFRTITSLIKLVEQHGVLPWFGGQPYGTGAVVMSSDNIVRKALRPNENKDPVSNPFDWGAAFSDVPIGTIVSWVPGYFLNNSNSGYTKMLGDDNTIAAANAYLNTNGWYVCNGAALNVAGSPIFGGANRYLPNLTDSRFLMGSNSAGSIGGSNTADHTHTTTVPAHTHTGTVGATAISIAQMPSHNHTFTYTVPGDGGGTSTSVTGDTGGGGTHTHTGGGTIGSQIVTSSAASVTENRPQYLTCFYIMKVI